MKIMIGFDPAETVAYHVLCNSIMRQASGPVELVPINKRNIPEFYRGKQDGSTEFSFSRFLTPYLAGYQGHALFMDCDMLVMGDIYQILDYSDNKHDVFVVKHNYTPTQSFKFLGNRQHAYPKKNWSSLMLFNCWMPNCKKLAAGVVNEATGKYLHQFEWTEEERVGSLPIMFNHLVGEYTPNPDAVVAHFTLGTPCFKGYEDQEYSKEWFEELERVNYAD